VLDAMIDERAHDHRGAGHLVRIVALVGHDVVPWLAPDPLLPAAYFGFDFRK
jgi:hypothetical protein